MSDTAAFDTPAWPVTLDHHVEAGTYRVRPVPRVVRTEVEQGPARQRARFRRSPSLIDCSWVMTAAELETFRYWLEEFLFGGAAWFTMPVYTDGAYSPHLVRWVAREENPYWRPRNGAALWDVGGTLEVRRLALTDPDLAVINILYGSAVFLELASLLHGAVHEDLPAIGPITGYAP